MRNRQWIIDYAVEVYRKNQPIEGYTVQDALVHSMEEHDTDDMTQKEYDQLLSDVTEKSGTGGVD